MQIELSRILKSLYRDLGFHQIPVPECQDAIDDITTLDLDAFRRQGSVLCDKIRRGVVAPSISPSDARRVFQYFGVLDKVPGDTKRAEVLERLIAKQPKIGQVLLDTPDIRELRRIIRMWIGDTPWGAAESLPKHGPGATAEKALWDDKWHALRSRPSSLEICFKKLDPLNRLSLKSLDDHPARVMVVEKNWKGGRVIAAEMASRQFVQQSLGRVMTARLRRAKIDISAADRHVDFLKNALKSSVTVDLSEASDFLSVGLVAALFPREWCRALFASRSRYLRVGRDVLKTKTLASMGNGFCFAVLTTVCGALCARASGQWSAGKGWSVFGDDIIIEERHYDKLRQLIVRAGLVINDDKTFTPDCPFAETCGSDFWRRSRTNVRPLYLRSHSQLSDFHDFVKLAFFQRQAVRRGWSETSSYILSCVGRYYPLQCKDEIDLPGWFLNEDARSAGSHGLIRWNRQLHRLEARAFAGSDPKRPSSLDEGESWAKATFGSDACVETLTRSRTLKLKWLPVPDVT